jgi:hypothetical protein
VRTAAIAIPFFPDAIGRSQAGDPAVVVVTLKVGALYGCASSRRSLQPLLSCGGRRSCKPACLVRTQIRRRNVLLDVDLPNQPTNERAFGLINWAAELVELDEDVLRVVVVAALERVVEHVDYLTGGQGVVDVRAERVE